MAQEEILNFLRKERMYGTGDRYRFISIVSIAKKIKLDRYNVGRACRKLWEYGVIDKASMLINSYTFVGYRLK